MMYPDPQERRPHAERVAAWEHALPAFIAHAKQFAPAYGRLLADVEATSINSLAALASLPITRKSALINEQNSNRRLVAMRRLPQDRRRVCLLHRGQLTNHRAQPKTFGV